METLRISPQYKADHWRRLDKTKAEHWPTAAAIVRDRLQGRFLKFADHVLTDPSSGFVVLAIDCLLVETIQQFKEGMIDGTGHAGRLCREFLEGPRFQPSFAQEAARRAFYLDIRCGLLHAAEAKNKWLVRRNVGTMLKTTAPDEYIIDVKLFHDAITQSLQDYLADILKPENTVLRDNLWTKMNHLCNVRESRGAMEVDDSAPTTRSADVDWLCDEVGDPAFLQMAHHETGHAIASRLVGVTVAVLKVSQRTPMDRFDRLSPATATGCSYCNNDPDSFREASWHPKALIKRAGYVAEQRYCGNNGRQLSDPLMDNLELQGLFARHAAKGDLRAEDKAEYERFINVLDEKLRVWLDRADVADTFEALIEETKRVRTDQGDGHYLCELDGTTVETFTARLAIEPPPLLNWP